MAEPGGTSMKDETARTKAPRTGNGMDVRTRERDEESAEDVAPRQEGSTSGREARPSGEGPARDGGSGLTAEEEPAEEEIGGGD